MLKRWFLVVGVFVFLCVAWNSYSCYNTHGPIFDATLMHISEEDFPDIHMYRSRIWKGCSFDGEEWAHRPYPFAQNGGHPESLWKGEDPIDEKEGVLPLYTDKRFGRAYFRLGNILHLVQDMCVPTHAVDIPHYREALKPGIWLWPEPMGPTIVDYLVGGYELDGFETYGTLELNRLREGDITEIDLRKRCWRAYKKAVAFLSIPANALL